MGFGNSLAGNGNPACLCMGRDPSGKGKAISKIVLTAGQGSSQLVSKLIFKHALLRVETDVAHRAGTTSQAPAAKHRGDM